MTKEQKRPTPRGDEYTAGFLAGLRGQERPAEASEHFALGYERGKRIARG